MKNLLNVFLNPSEAFQSVKERETIFLPILILVVVLSGTSLILNPIAAIDNYELVSQNPRLSGMLTEQQLDDIRHPSTSRVAIGTVMSPVGTIVGYLIYSLLIMIIARVSGYELKYKTVLAAVLTTAMIDPVLAAIVKTPMVMAKGTSLSVSTSLSLLAPEAPITSLTYIVLEVFDLFAIWALIVLIIGISVLADVTRGKAAAVVLTAWTIKSAALIALSVISLRLSGMS